MSEAVRAALAAKRAAAKQQVASRSRSSSPVKSGAAAASSSGSSQLADSVATLRPISSRASSPSATASGRSTRNGPSSRSNRGQVDAEESDNSVGNLSGYAQASLESLLLKACSTGKLGITSRVPALKSLPEELFDLAKGPEPSWHEKARGNSNRAWYERQDLRSLQANGNALADLDERIGEFRALQKIELQQNALHALPRSLLNLWHLTVLTLSSNQLVEFPVCVLALDSLHTLDLSSNRLKTLWNADSVLTARSGYKVARKAWEKENGPVDQDGMWSGFLSGPSSPVKKDRKRLLDPGPLPPTAPMHSLKVLNLSGNRLRNDALERDGSAFAFPPRIRSLDLSNNDLRISLPASVFAGLPGLTELKLAGTGITDQVFANTGSEDLSIFDSLALLDLANCDIDDLAPLEALFGSGRIREQGQEIGDDTSSEVSRLPATSSFARKQLIKTKGSPGLSEDVESLHVVLDGCPLREEEMKRRRGPGLTVRAATSLSHTQRKESKDAAKTEPKQSSGFQPVGGDFGSPGAPSVTSPGTAALRSGLTTSPPRSGGPILESSPPPPLASALAMQAQMQLANLGRPTVQKEEWELMAEAGLLTEGGKRRMRAEQARRAKEREAQSSAQAASGAGRAKVEVVNKTGLSDWDGEPSPSKGKAVAQPHERSQPTASDSLTLSQEDFFDGDADAGSALANAKLSSKKKEALSQVPCKFFRSNGCSAGTACPFAHTFPGEGLQKATCQWFLKGNCRFGHKCALAHIFPGQPISMDRKNKRAVQHGLPLPPVPSDAQLQDEAMRVRAPGPAFALDPHSSLQGSQQQWMSPEHPTIPTGRESDLVFGMPDDLRRAGGVSMPGTSGQMRQSTPLRFGEDGTHVGSPGSRAFGTSPFSQGGHVFYSGSQESEGQFAHYGRQRLGLDEDGGPTEEDLLPSSLSELFTPEELERRARSGRAAQSLPASAGVEREAWPSSLDDESSMNVPSQHRIGHHLTADRSAYPYRAAGGSSFAAAGTSPFNAPQVTAPHAYSPATRAALGQHAPGQSLPRGLAAGLSRLHLKNVEDLNESIHIPAAPAIPSLQQAGQFDDLAPIAPSSVLPTRHGFQFEQSGMRAGVGSLSSSPRSFGAYRSEEGLLNAAPQSNGSAPSAPQMSPSKSALGRVRGTGPLIGSPLASSTTARGRDDDEDAIFQFE